MFVHPALVRQTAARHPEIVKARLVVDNPDHADRMVLRCELGGEGGDALRARIAESLRAVCKLRGEVEFVARGGLPDDGVAIEDARVFD